jgi:hypothetical protein
MGKMKPPSIDSDLLCRQVELSTSYINLFFKLEKKYAPTLDDYGQSCFVRRDFLKMKCVCKTQMMPPPDHKKLKTSQKFFNTMYDVHIQIDTISLPTPNLLH